MQVMKGPSVLLLTWLTSLPELGASPDPCTQEDAHLGSCRSTRSAGMRVRDQCTHSQGWGMQEAPWAALPHVETTAG